MKQKNSDKSAVEIVSTASSANQVEQDKAHQGYHFAEQVGHQLRRAYQRHVAIFQEMIPDSQLTSAQFVVMCAVLEQHSCSLTDITKMTAIDQATVRDIVKRLKARALLAVDHDLSDKRKVLVRLTDQGSQLINEVLPFAARITESTFGELNPAERMALLYLLQKMNKFDQT